MEIKITSKTMLKVLEILSWVIFVGLCIEAGGIIFNAFYALAINPIGAKNYWMGADLSSLYQFDPIFFFVETFFMSIAAVMKALLFYLIVKLLHENKLSLSQPFNEHVKRFIQIMAYLALGIGSFSHFGSNYAEWFTKQGVVMPTIESLKLGGADVWIFMGITLLVIAQIFKRGIEIQSENELTI